MDVDVGLSLLLLLSVKWSQIRIVVLISQIEVSLSVRSKLNALDSLQKSPYNFPSLRSTLRNFDAEET